MVSCLLPLIVIAIVGLGVLLATCVGYGFYLEVSEFVRKITTMAISVMCLRWFTGILFSGAMLFLFFSLVNIKPCNEENVAKMLGRSTNVQTVSIPCLCGCGRHR